jgi:hypothetical protein
MYKQSKLGQMALAMAVAVAAAGVATAGNDVGSGGKTVNEVYGRAAGGAGNGAVVGSGGGMSVSDVGGRGSRLPAITGRPVDTSEIGVEHLGRGPAPMAKAHSATGDTLAQSR